MQHSIWNYNYKAAGAGFKGEKKCDTVVVGGGIAGVLTAYQLAEKGINVTLLEAERLYAGTTHNTTAHMDCLQGYLYCDLSKESVQKAALYYESQRDAIDEYERIISKHGISCHFTRSDSFLFTTKNIEKLMTEYDALKASGAPAEFIGASTLLKVHTLGAIKLPRQAHFNPLEFLEGLPKNFEIIESTRILKVDVKDRILYSKDAVIKADRIIIATGFPIIDVPGFYFLKMYKSHSYTIAIKTAHTLEAMYQGDLQNSLTYRQYEDNIIIGGLDHRSGRVDEDRKYDRLEEKAAESFGASKTTHRWSANDCVTFDGVPLVGAYNKNDNGLYVITGFNKWGMTNAMAGACVLRDIINGKKNKFQPLFSPFRKKTQTGSFLNNALSTVNNLIIKPISVPSITDAELLPDSGDIVLHNGRKKAVYKDSDGELHICEALCKHLKCQLQFNPNTKTWDCPCHGSRFDIHGKLIVGPATEDLDL